MGSKPGQPLDDRELAAWRGMLRVAVELRRTLGRRLEEHHDLTMADYDVLLRLADDPEDGVRMAELADTVLQPRSSLTRIVGGLERRGLVERRPDADDGRGASAVLTADGLAAYRRARVDHHDGIRELFVAHLTEAQLDELAGAWRAVNQGAGSAAQPAG